MHFHVFCNQKNLSSSHTEAINEFQKRLSAYCETSLSVTTTPCILPSVRADNSHIFIVKSGISDCSSEQFAEKIKDLQLSGKSHIIIFVHYAEQILYEQHSNFFNSCNIYKMSLTGFNLSAETVTLLLCEQLYRGFTILQGKTYHK